MTLIVQTSQCINARYQAVGRKIKRVIVTEAFVSRDGEVEVRHMQEWFGGTYSYWGEWPTHKRIEMISIGPHGGVHIGV